MLHLIDSYTKCILDAEFDLKLKQTWASGEVCSVFPSSDQIDISPRVHLTDVFSAPRLVSSEILLSEAILTILTLS